MSMETPNQTLKPVRWGVLGAGNFAQKVSLPGMKRGPLTEIVALASRDIAKAQAAAEALGIPRAYGSYEELLADPEIEVVYNPLPNHMHVDWSARAARAGKHVLCEKPVALDAADAETLIAVQRETGKLICEAFMIRYHPQWRQARDWVQSGRIGELLSVQTAFCYFNRDATNIRNRKDVGGGALYDIGCYCIQSARYAFGGLPTRVVGVIDRDPDFGTDRLTSALLDFPGGQAIFACSTQLIPYQRVHFLGTKGRIEIEIPFNAPKDRPTRMFIDESGNIHGSGIVTEEFPTADQYTMQGDAFAKAVFEGGEVPVPLEDAIANMAVIEAIFKSADSNTWVKPEN